MGDVGVAAVWLNNYCGARGYNQGGDYREKSQIIPAGNSLRGETEGVNREDGAAGGWNGLIRRHNLLGMRFRGGDGGAFGGAFSAIFPGYRYHRNRNDGSDATVSDRRPSVPHS